MSSDKTMTLLESRLTQALQQHYPDADVGLFMDECDVADMPGFSVLATETMVQWTVEFAPPYSGTMEVTLDVLPGCTIPDLHDALDQLDAIRALIEASLPVLKG